MKNVTSEPDDARLRVLLDEARPSPPLPPRFQLSVWRRLDRAEMPRATSLWAASLDALLRRLLRPRMTLFALTALMLFSGVAGALHSTATTRRAAQERYLAAVAPEPLD